MSGLSLIKFTPMNTFKTLLIISAVLLLGAELMTAQSISRSVITFGGSEYTSSNGLSLDATMGQIAIETFNGPYTLTQGFQQGDLLDAEFAETPEIDASVFPNPFEDELQINLRLDAEIEMRVYNVLGQLVYFTFPQTEEFTLRTSDWHTGVYFINFSAGGKRLNVEKVIKHTSK